MICLGIESTAHTFGIGIVKDKKILANVKKTYTTEEGGMIPAKVADHHVEICDKILQTALSEAGKKLGKPDNGKSAFSVNDVDVIAYSASPGIGHMLRIGWNVARSLSVLYEKDLVEVNHCIAHLEIGKLRTKRKDPILLYVSGANTQVIGYEGERYRVFGESLDGGVGNFIDSFAREIGLGFPGGPKIEKLALKGKEYIKLPYTVKGMDISVGGLFTNLKQKISKYKKEDLAYSLQETVFAMLIEVAERAMAHCNKNELVLGGGVCCNKRLQEMAKKMCEERTVNSGQKTELGVPENEFLVDNGAMIAWTGLVLYKQGIKTNVEKSDIYPYLRTDEA